MGLHLIRNNLNIDFIRLRKISYIISLAVILVGMASLIIKGGPKYGIDFAGGATVQLKFETPITDEELKASLAHSSLPGLVVQNFGEDNTAYLLRISVMEESSEGLTALIKTSLASSLKDRQFSIPLLEMVGPKVGADLRTKAMEAIYYSILLIAVYISGRFENRWGSALIMAGVLGGVMFGLAYFGVNRILLVAASVVAMLFLCWKLKLTYALGAVVCILHDVLITIGIFSLLDKEFDLTIIAALLTVVGYSLNDTIIIYDRIRENLRGDFVTPLGDIINRSINQTLSRTVLTSGTTLLVILALLVFGGGIIFDFALVLCIGVVVGTLSSIFVASVTLFTFGDSLSRENTTKKVDKRPRGSDGRLAPQV